MTKIDIFSGFLGAGKTTLIRKLIAEAYIGEKLVLVENEFGEIGIDGGFMKDAGIQITEMNSGCICCSLVGDFTKALNQVLEEFAPDRILIEPSGVGKLSDVIHAVESVERQGVILSGATTVVNAEKCRMYMRNFGEFFNNQVEYAGTIVLSRTQNLSEEKLANCVAMLREHNAEAVIITTPWEELDGKIIAEAITQQRNLDADIHALRQEQHAQLHGENCSCGCHDHEHAHEHDHDHEHHHEHAHEHEHHHADDIFNSWGAETTHVYKEEELQSALEKLSESTVYGVVLRAKGIVDGANGWLHFDYVPGEINIRPGAADVTGRLCVIGAALQDEALSALFKVK